MTTTIAAQSTAPRRARSIGRVALAGLALFLLYVALSFVNDPRGTLSTDVGGKVATLEVMDRADTASPDVGYWAAQWDPSASMHGLYYTSVVDGKYVNVTTLPVLELARPLYVWGGYRAALLWSMLGAVASAFAARALASRSGASDRRAWVAFGLTGLASPALLYALDLWEHAPGLALMSWAVVAMVDTASGRARWATALAAGAGFGAAFSMRTEAAAYGFVVVAIGCLLLWRRRNIVRAAAAGALAAAGFVLLVAANYVLEVAVIGASLRTGRASGTAAAGGSDVVIRLREAVTTTVGLFPDTGTRALLLGSAAIGLVAWAVWRGSRPGDPKMARLAMVGAGVLFLLRAVDGLGFVPGLMATAPFAVAGAVLAFDHRVDQRGRDAVLMVGLALPAVWLFQYSGGAVPQWGGRYVLTSGLVLAAVGIGASGLLDRGLRYALAGLSVAVAIFGLAFMSYRTHEIGRAADTIGAIDVPVVSAQDFFLREVGAAYRADSPWLSVTGLGEVPAAAAVVDQAGERSFDLLWVPDAQGKEPPPLPGWEPTDDDRTETWLEVDFRLTRYQRTG